MIHNSKQSNPKKRKRLIFVALVTLGFSIGFLPDAYSATQLVDDWYLNTTDNISRGSGEGVRF